MWGLNKTIFFIKHVVRMVFSNITRFVLSVCGLFVGMFILTVGLLLMNSYYDECMSKANQFADNTIEIQVDGDKDEVDTFVKKCNTAGIDVTQKEISLDSSTIYIKKYTNDNYCCLKTKLVGTTNMKNNMVLAEYNDDLYIPYDSELVYGRYINDKDLANDEKIVVIDLFTSKLLFGEENPIGKGVKIDVTAEGTAISSNDKDTEQAEEVPFKVVGVYENKKITKINENYLEEFKRNGNDDLMMETMIYIPMSMYTRMRDDGEICFLIKCSDSQNYYNTLKYIEDYKSIHEADFHEFNVVIKSDVIKSLESDLKPLKIFMWIILAFLLLLSGINSMNTMFFSVKERIGEIGIKKSLGASRCNIILQFMLEGIIMALISCVIAIICGVLVGGLLATLIQNIMFINFSVSYSTDLIYLPLIVAGIYGIVFSFLPSYYGANIKVTDALRFE